MANQLSLQHDVVRVDYTSEMARQEAIRRGYGPRMADWFERGAYAASKNVYVPPSRRPTRAWYLNGVRWFEAQETAS